MDRLKKSYEELTEFYNKEVPEKLWQDEGFYANWLAQTYYYVSHSTRLILLASAYFDFNYQNLHNRFMDYVKEERNHEKLALNDLKNLKHDIKNIPEFASTSGMYQSQYYWIQHRGAPSFFGYILALEGLAVHSGKKLYEQVNSKFAKSCSFLKVHIQEDVDHLKQAFSSVESFKPQDLEVMIMNLKQSSRAYVRMIKECEERAAGGALRKVG
jgi:hypothetical protein